MVTELNLKDIILNRKIGVYRINLDQKEKLKQQLRKFHKLFNENDLMWITNNDDDYISLGILNDINIDL